MSTSVHQSEPSRLAALRSLEVLDTPPEAEFDRLTVLAADLFDAPMALISLLDGSRQWFKSRHGVKVSCTPREQAFCRFALELESGSVLVVPDATTDSRFAENPLVTGEMNLRFYAGAVLTTSDGAALGTLCVLDTVARPRPSDRALSRLVTLAQIAVDALESRRRKRQAEREAALLGLAEQMSGIGAWRFDVSSGVVTWSDAVYQVHGVTPATFDPNIGDAVNFYHPDDRAMVRDQLVRAIRTGEGFDFQARLIDQAMRERIVNSQATSELDEAGAVLSIYGVFQDVTDQIQALREVKHSEARLRLLTDNMGDVITSVSLTGGGKYVSPSVQDLLNYNPADMAGQSAQSFVHPDDRPQILETYSDLASGADSRTLEHRAVRKDGSIVWVETNFKLVRDHGGAPSEIVAVVRDISVRRAIEASLADSEMRYRTLAESVSDILLRYDADGRITYISPACSLLGFSPDEVIGQPLATFVVSGQRSGSEAVIARNLAGTPPDRPLHCVATRDGAHLWMEGRPRAIRGADGAVKEVVTVLRDVTQRVAMEQALVSARAEAEAAAAAKAEFLANMSHEIRTPLTAVIGFSGLLAGMADLPDQAKDHVRRIQSGGRALLATVNDILDFSKLEAGQVEIRLEACKPAAVARDALELFEANADARGLSLSLIDDTPEAAVLLDAGRLRQILLNLIGNAVKFTEQGGVSVRLTWGDDRLWVGVTDSGAGISSENQALLFRKFSQVDASSTRRHGGTGLGLAICLGLAEAMGGEIGVDSTPGQGSTFWFVLPAPAATTAGSDESLPTAPTDHLGDLSAARVLVADDNPANRNLARALLEALGADCLLVADGEEAVQAAQCQVFDLILMDIRMPGLGGIEAARAIRTGGGPNDGVPILAFTAERERGGLDPVFAGVIDKPIELEALQAAVALALNPPTTEESSHAA